MADHFHVYEIQRDMLDRRQLVRSYSVTHHEPAVSRLRAILGAGKAVLVEPCDRELLVGQQPHDCPATMDDRAF
jgi:hypothetical protein